jgi:squalene synthase HpnD
MDVVIFFGTVVVGIICNMAASEFYDRSSEFARWIVRRALSQIPAKDRQRLEEEWLADIGDYPGKLSQVVRACGIFRAGRKLLAQSISEYPGAAVRAGGSFYAAMRILPTAQRDGMYEIYSFCRLVDDIADSVGPRAKRLQQLQDWRDRIDVLFEGRLPDELRGLSWAVQHFGLQKEDFHAVIDGMAMDVPEDIRAPDQQTLDLYCDRVASAVGRLSVKVFGLALDDGILLAHHLGRALQLTNVLRDIDGDAEIGRVYLPREALGDAGIYTTDPRNIIEHPRLPLACTPVVALARQHFEKADEIMDRNKRRNVRATRIMSEYYRQILELLVSRGFALPRQPVRLNKGARIKILLRHAFI